MSERLSDDEALAELREVLAPPTNPWPGDVSWAAFEHVNGIVLPTSFRRFVDTYGTGTVEKGGWWIQIHDVVPPGSRFVDLSEWERELQRQSRATAAVDAEPVFPRAGGRLTWGYNDDGVLLGWRLVGEPDTWVICGDAPDTEFTGSFLEFVLAWVRGELPTTSALARQGDERAGGTGRFAPNRADTYAAAGEASASVRFASYPRAGDDFGDITSWDRWQSLLAPAALAEAGARGDDAALELTYHPSDEAEVRRHLRQMRLELGVAIRSIRDGHDHDLWPDLVG